MHNAAAGSARRVHSVLAALVADPTLLEHLTHSPAARRKAGLGGLAIEFDKIRGFTGLTTKVRHNDVRLRLPFTFKLLDQLGISIEVFADYAGQAASLRKSGKNRVAQKISSFVSFLDGWLDRDDPAHRIIWDLVRHEQAIAELQAAADATSSRTRRWAVVALGSRLCPISGLIRHELSCNPVDVVKMLRSGRCELGVTHQRQVYLTYSWDCHERRVNVLQIDEIAFVLLDLVDGERSVAEIATLLREVGAPIRGQALCDAFQKLVGNGLIDVPDMERAPCI